VHEVAPSVDEWAERIRPHLDRAAESFVAAGRELTAAKAALPHGGFLELVASLDLAPRTAQRLMQIAHHPVFSDATRGSHLPNAWRTLAELARVPEDDLLAAIESGVVHPRMRRADAEQLVHASTKNTDMPVDEAHAIGVQVRALQYELGEMFFDYMLPLVRKHGTVPDDALAGWDKLVAEIDAAQKLTELFGEYWLIEAAAIVMAIKEPDFSRPWSEQMAPLP